MCIKGCTAQEQKNATQEKPYTEFKNIIESCSSRCKPYKNPTTSQNGIGIRFHPKKSCYDIKCQKIAIIQFVRNVIDGKVTKYKDWYSGFEFKDQLATPNGWVVDHVKNMNTPDVQSLQKIISVYGSKNGGSTIATIFDAPQTDGGDKGFYDPENNKNGAKRIVKEFATFSYCMEGEDCGKWYEGITWKYIKTSQDHNNGSAGKSELTSSCVKQPTKEMVEAFNKFNKEKGFTPCQ